MRYITLVLFFSVHDNYFYLCITLFWFFDFFWGVGGHRRLIFVSVSCRLLPIILYSFFCSSSSCFSCSRFSSSCFLRLLLTTNITSTSSIYFYFSYFISYSFFLLFFLLFFLIFLFFFFFLIFLFFFFFLIFLFFFFFLTF
jgi:hypothetical protein